VFKKRSRRHEGGGFRREKQFRLVTSAATALATILELTLPACAASVFSLEREAECVTIFN